MVLEALLQRIDPSNYIYELNSRKDLTWNIIQKYPALPWPADALSRLAPLDYIEQHKNLLWDYNEISERSDLTIDFIRQYKYTLNWCVISTNIDFQDVIENPDLSWIWECLSWNGKITQNDIIENPDLPWDYSRLSNHIELQFVYANPDLPWDYSSLSDRIDLDFIRQNPHCNWDYYNLSQNPNLTIEFILEHLEQEWDWKSIYINPNITLEDILTNNLQYINFESFQYKYPDYCLEHLQDLNWEIISESASLDCIRKYPNKPWKYSKLSINPNINIDFVLEHPALPWYYSELSKNPGISLEDVLNNWDLPWDVNSIVAYKY